MALRMFTDRAGTDWQVWDRDREGRDGRLCFQSATEKRRLTPVPAHWEQVSAERLELFCRVADPVETQVLAEASSGF